MNINRDIKQVIVMRKDLNMRKGKMCAQAAHASIHFTVGLIMDDIGPSRLQIEWLTQGMTKICVGVNSEAELIDIYDKAEAAGLTVHLITDAGLTEFDGPTKTCLAIGPNRAEHIDEITGELKLL
jgi:PTH2 family peptidyl-tRNA hydrolase